MDGARSLRSLRADRDGPRAYFHRSAREEALQPQQVICLAHQARQARFLKPHGFQILCCLSRIELCQIRLHLRADRHRRHTVDLSEIRIERILVHVGNVEHRLHGQQMQIVDKFALLVS